jgi:beta-fructofuranosidase
MPDHRKPDISVRRRIATMQYFKPQAVTRFVGDCMPFFHDGTFHLIYLLDEEHHRARNGFGGHQWAHASTKDLIHWQHHPLAVPVGAEGEFDYLSICTGSIIVHDSIFHAFYATRRVGDGGERSEHLCRATSADGIHFIKDQENPFASPGAWYDQYNFRDPHVFRDEQSGQFHMLVTACERRPAIDNRAGCLAHLVSSDLFDWELRPPFISGLPGRPGYGLAPECCDYFEWNGWYYLIWSDPPHATTYRMAREPFGPWIRPTVDTFDAPMARVFKTAPFTGGRRLAVAFLTSLAGNKDDGAWEYAGNALFRELIQYEDGTLGTCWPREMIPASTAPVPLNLRLSGSTSFDEHGALRVVGPHPTAANLDGIPANARLSLRISPGLGTSYFGLRLRGTAGAGQGYQLQFAPREQTVRVFSVDNPATINHRGIADVTGLDQPFDVDIVMCDDIIDVCVDGRRCLCTRLPEQRGSHLSFFNEHGEVTFANIEVRALLEHASAMA